MTPDEELLSELKKLNKNLDSLNNPIKNAFNQFSSGVWHSLGSILITVLLTFAVIYLLGQFNITKILTDYVKKLVPQPQINLTVPSLQLSPGQL